MLVFAPANTAGESRPRSAAGTAAGTAAGGVGSLVAPACRIGSTIEHDREPSAIAATFSIPAV